MSEALDNLEQEDELEVLSLLMEPLAAFCVRHSHSMQDLIKAAKPSFIKAAATEIRKSNAKVNVSRISAMTGLYRQEVTRIYKEKEKPIGTPPSVLSRVVGQWCSDKRFLTSTGRAKVLSLKGENSEFKELVESVSKAINPGTIAFELKRKQHAIETPRGLKLLVKVIAFDHDAIGGFKILSEDISALIQAVEENLLNPKHERNLHLSTEYDNIAQEHLWKIRRWLTNEGKKLHKRARARLARYDADINTDIDPENAGGKVRLGTFSFTSTPTDSDE